MRAGTAGLSSAEEGAGMEGLTRGHEEVPAAPGTLEMLRLPSHNRAGGNYCFTVGEHGKLTRKERGACKGKDFS